MTWEVCPPLSSPGAGFGQLDVAQVKPVDGQWVLVFTCHRDEQTPRRCLIGFRNREHEGTVTVEGCRP